MADAHPEIDGTVMTPGAEMPFGDLPRDRRGNIGWNLHAFVDKITHGGGKNEVAGAKEEGGMTAKGHPAATLENRTIEGLACGFPLDPPCARAFHELGKTGGGLKESDDFSERIDDHNRTHAKENETLAYITSAFVSLDFAMSS
jgi:hypothetical protein